jgi:hypothetical protein
MTLPNNNGTSLNNLLKGKERTSHVCWRVCSSPKSSAYLDPAIKQHVASVMVHFKLPDKQ